MPNPPGKFVLTRHHPLIAFHPGIILPDCLLVISSQSACLAFSPIWLLKDGVLWGLTSPFDDRHPAFDIHHQTPSFKSYLPARGSPVYSSSTDFSPNSSCWLTLLWNSWITFQAQQIHAELVFFLCLVTLPPQLLKSTPWSHLTTFCLLSHSMPCPERNFLHSTVKIATKQNMYICHFPEASLQHEF